MRLLPISTPHSGSNGSGRKEVECGGQGYRVVGFYFCFVAALLTRSPLKFNQAESVCLQASGCSAAPACRECGVFKERKQAGRQAGTGNSGTAGSVCAEVGMFPPL